MVKNELYAPAGVNSSITKHKSTRSLPTSHRRQASNTLTASPSPGTTAITFDASAGSKQKNSNHKRKKSNVVVSRSRNASPANDLIGNLHVGPINNNLLSANYHSSSASLGQLSGVSKSTATASNVVNVCKIFVGGLSWETTQTSLHQYFVKFGEIAECVLMLDPHSQRSRGFGFVTFVNSDSVGSVLSSGPHILDKKVIDPKAAIPRTNKDIITITNVSSTNTATTANHNNNNTNTNNTNSNNNNNFNMAVNSFGSNNACNSEMNYDEFESIPKFNITENIDHSDYFENIDEYHMYHEISSNHNETEQNSCLKIFVGGIGNISENVVREYFEKFGRLTDVTIMYDKVTGKHRGFGFVGFETAEAVEQVCKSRFHAIHKKTIEVKKAVPKDTNLSIATSKKGSLSPQYHQKAASNQLPHSFNANMLNMGSYESPLQFFSFNPYTRMQPSSMPHDLCFEYYSSFLNYINETNKVSPHIDLLNKSAERDSLDCLNDINAFNIATASLKKKENTAEQQAAKPKNNISNDWEFQDAMLNNSLYVSEEEYENFEKKLSFKKEAGCFMDNLEERKTELFEMELKRGDATESARRNSFSAVMRVDVEVEREEYNKENTENYPNRKLLSESRYNVSTSTDSSLRRTL